MIEEAVVEIAEDLFLIKQPFHEHFTGVTVVLGKRSIGLIDTGLETTPADHVFPLLNKMGRKPDEIDCIVNTHGDGDHIWGNKAIKEKTRAKIAVHALDADRVGSVDVKLKDGETIRLGDKMLRVIHTPGHSRGSICLYDEKNRTLIAGDSVQGCGVTEGNLLIRTSKVEYIRSMKKLLSLQIAILVLDHPYKPFGKAVLTGNEPREMILTSIEAAKTSTNDR